jgi:hypothetical protein
MILSDVTNKSGLLQECERICQFNYGGITGNTDLKASFVASINRHYSNVWHTVFSKSGNWKFDDSNYDNLPQASENLIAGKYKYLLPSEALIVEKVEVLDESGTARVLIPVSQENINNIQEEAKKTGIPSKYRLIERQTEVYPVPTYSKTAGIKWYFSRENYQFTVSDDAKSPGFASPYHRYLSVCASIDWLIVHKPKSESLRYLLMEKTNVMKQIEEHYSTRFDDQEPVRFIAPVIRAK